MELKEAVKNLLSKYDDQWSIEIKAETKAAKTNDAFGEAMAKGGQQALRALRGYVQSVYNALYPTPDEKLAFISEPLYETDTRAIRAQIRTLKSSEQYQSIGRIAERVLDFWEGNNDTDQD